MTDASNKSLILIDDANLYYGLKRQRWELDYKKFYDWLKRNFDVLDVFFFGGIISKKTFFDRHPSRPLSDFVEEKGKRENFFRFLKETGYHVKTKPIASLYDSTEGTFKRKCNFDVELTIIALDRIAEYQELVLCSGDGDFEKLLKYVKGKHKKATIIAPNKDRLSSNLALSANRVISLESIRKEVEMKRGSP